MLHLNSKTLLLLAFAILISAACNRKQEQSTPNARSAIEDHKLNRLDWGLIYRVSQHSRIATDAEIDEIERSCGELPQGYALFVKEFGYGSLDDIDVLTPEAITEQTPFLRKQVLAEWLSFCDSLDELAVIPRNSIHDAVPFAKTAWGDYYFSSPSQPETLWHMWRSHDWADSSPTQIPLGFGNLFLHRFVDGSIEELGPSSPVFRPVVETNMQQRLLSPIGSIHTLEEFLDRCEELIQPSRLDRDEHGALMFAVDLGAEFRFGKRKANQTFVVTSIYPPEQEAAILRVISAIVGSEFKSEPLKQE
ncbi:hypothetical protein GCM10023156_45090 [Novipirellula rosea]|uniref:SMI1 / KNR4 family protein n=1 Tax=Novipirellula rosea TaxID=1031540 RepID=A0ABP8N8V1_9BACT